MNRPSPTESDPCETGLLGLGDGGKTSREISCSTVEMLRVTSAADPRIVIHASRPAEDRQRPADGETQPLKTLHKCVGLDEPPTVMAVELVTREVRAEISHSAIAAADAASPPSNHTG